MTKTLFDWGAQYHKPKVSLDKASASQLPYSSGDGYSYGGGAVLTIGGHAFMIGEGGCSFELAPEIARPWSADGPHVLV